MFGRAVRSELYRIKTLKSTYILIAVLGIIIFITNFMYMKVDLYGLFGFSQERIEQIQELGTTAEGYQESFMAGFQAGLESTQAMSEGGTITILGEGPMYYESVPVIFSLDQGGLYELMLIAIFVGIYIGNIYSTGLDRNLNLFSGNRTMLFGVRMMMIALYAMVLHIFMWIYSILSAALMGYSVRLEIDRSFILFFIITWMLTVAFASIVGAMTYLTKSKAAGITLGIILSAGVFSTILSLSSLMIQKKFGLDEGFNLGYYTVTQNLAAITLNSDGHFVLRAVICSIVYFTATYILASVVVNKRDIA